MKTQVKHGDIWLILGVLAIAAGLFAMLWFTPGESRMVEVRVDGTVYTTLPLDTPATLKIPGINGVTNTLVIADGRASMTHAACPDGLCVRTGKISKVGETIICLPHKLSVTVTGEAEEGPEIIPGAPSGGVS